MLFIQCKGTHLFTHGVWNVGNDISYGLMCIFYNIFQELSSNTMKTATSVFAIRCRIAIDVVGFVEFDGRLCSLFYWIYFKYNSKRHWKVKIISTGAKGM